MAFQLGGLDDSDSNSEELPFPAPIAHDAFSGMFKHFSPHEFLSSLRNRHQTLEDLRAELRTRSKDFERELVELVNRDYVDFIGLGASVEGGESRVEDLKVGLMGFRREVEGVVAKLEATKIEVERELRIKDAIRREKTLARNFLTLGQRVDELSSLLLLDDPADSGIGPSAFFDDGEGLSSLKRLRKLVASWIYLQEFLIPKIPETHPFVKIQKERMIKIKTTILIDLSSALKEEARQKNDQTKYLDIMGLFSDMGAESEAIKTLKEVKKQKS